MSQEIEANYSEQWVFPPSLEDLVPGKHPARMVREFVDAQDMEGMGFKGRVSEDGRPSYSKSLLLKVWLYGYMTKIRSCRALERACLDQMGMLWLTGMNAPDHTTLWRFWRDNQEGLRRVFKQLLQIAVSLELVGMVLHAVDGTRILSAASEQKAWRVKPLKEKLAQLDEAIAEILKQTETAESQDEGEAASLPEELEKKQELKSKIVEQLSLLTQQEREQLNPGDPEARVMKTRSGKKFAYNAQAVADEKSKLIVAADVVTDESDNYQLVPMLDQVQENLGKVAEQTCADAGYKAVTQLAEAEEKGHSVLVNLAEPVDAPYHASRFVYDPQTDQCICPQGERLEFERTDTRDKVRPYEIRIYRCQSYQTCPVRWQCSKSKTGRTVCVHANNDALVRQRQKLKDEAMGALLKKRGAIIEPVFGWGKEVLGFRRWTVRGKEKVKTQWVLLCTAMNLLRLQTAWVSGKLRFATTSAR